MYKKIENRVKANTKPAQLKHYSTHKNIKKVAKFWHENIKIVTGFAQSLDYLIVDGVTVMVVHYLADKKTAYIDVCPVYAGDDIGAGKGKTKRILL